MCTVYLLWDVIYAVPVQEKLDQAIRYTIRHLLQDVVSQIELHEVLQVLEHVPSQIAVTQLRRMSTKHSYVYLRSANCCFSLLISKQHSVADAHREVYSTWLWYRSSRVRFIILLKAPAGILEI